ncbi:MULTISPECIES: hypothetical protein [Desulfitobacterium]|uniref:Uncharacterized protein n=1 Tax=Desulfitobacterium dehalogenans (strain ATCC 51507 / DSM 9161 / JW/IU-DC1) TaxID=756499 RepID=I4ABC4_DESDJ|nr:MULTISPECIES: hypothetical protein [Desulfitobacterium]AFM01259.1 hypothetical protein Desde_2959 [Desulfitobacterium dehalogenans ATCC 51507]
MIKKKEIMRKHLPKLSHIVLLTLVIVLCLIGGILVLRRQEVGALRKEISHIEGLILQTSAKEAASDPLLMDDLLVIMDECVKGFTDEKLTVFSYHLEGILEGEVNPSILRFALIRLRVQGSWAEIERGLTHIETMPRGGIHVEEVVLEENGGEILLKLFFLEPDNLS